LTEARRKIQQAKSTHALGVNIRVPTLVALCRELNLDIGSLSKQRKLPLKKDLLDVLEQWVRTVNQSFIQDLNNYGSGRGSCMVLQIAMAF
jgi:hypothetical protein